MAAHRFNDQSLTWLYRYRTLGDHSLQWVERIFTHGEMYCAPPSALNDPSELKPIYDLSGSREEIDRYIEGLCMRRFPWLQGAERQRVREQMAADFEKANQIYGGAPSPDAEAYVRAEIEKVGVCCFSETWSSTMMWAHYAGNHSGICIRFKASSQTPFFGRAQRISYQKDYPRVRLLTDSESVRAQRTLLTKGEQWSYEREWRILDTDTGPGIKTFPTKFIDSVLLGSRISAPKEIAVRAWVKGMAHQATVQKVVAVPGSFELALA